MIISEKNLTPFDGVATKELEEGLLIADGEKPKYKELRITENGDYTAASENVDGFSSVHAEVANPAHLTNLQAYFPIRQTEGAVGSIGIHYSENGEYSIEFNNAPQPWDMLGHTLLYPAKKIIAAGGNGGVVVFTPSEDFSSNSIIRQSNQEIITLNGDEVTPGDGNIYCAKIMFNYEIEPYVYEPIAKITKLSNSFTYTLE